MCCPHCQGAEAVFDDKEARNEIREYEKQGPRKTTSMLLEALRKAGVHGLSLLDIGGGVGVIQHELAAAGVARSTDVDASSNYLRVAREAASKRGYAEAAAYIHGDFVQVASEIEPADIVTLDRVVCCYPDVHKLVSLSSARANRYYALVYPRDFRLFRWLTPLANLLLFRLRGNPFSIFIHPTAMIDAIVRGAGFDLLYHKKTGLWQVFVYKKGAGA